jgi:hypothetical protein
MTITTPSTMHDIYLKASLVAQSYGLTMMQKAGRLSTFVSQVSIPPPNYAFSHVHPAHGDQSNSLLVRL